MMPRCNQCATHSKIRNTGGENLGSSRTQGRHQPAGLHGQANWLRNRQCRVFFANGRNQPSCWTTGGESPDHRRLGVGDVPPASLVTPSMKSTWLPYDQQGVNVAQARLQAVRGLRRAIWWAWMVEVGPTLLSTRRNGTASRDGHHRRSMESIFSRWIFGALENSEEISRTPFQMTASSTNKRRGMERRTNRPRRAPVTERARARITTTLARGVKRHGQTNAVGRTIIWITTWPVAQP